MFFEWIECSPEARLHGIKHALEELSYFLGYVDRSVAQGYDGRTVILGEGYRIAYLQRD